jgi:hypothetical protein
MKFALERFVLGGPIHRILVIAVLIGILTVIGGTLVFLFGGEAHRGVGLGDSIWWAFLRLSDPGYLGDDTGTFVRIVSTALTVLGYVVFLGSLVAIMTQFLNASLTRLQSGFTPLALNNHILILGWSSRTVSIVREILLSEGRVRRFLTRSGSGRLRVVILAEEVLPEIVQELRERLGKLWNPKRIILRTGSPLRLEHLRRADFLRAAAIVLPAPDSSLEGVEYPDARTIKTILATGKASSGTGNPDMPLMVAELSDASKLSIATMAYGGPIEAVASDLIIGRLLAQCIRHPGLSHVYADMLRHDAGSEIYLREFPEMSGEQLGRVVVNFPRAIPLGLLRARANGCEAILNPVPGTLVEEGDRLVLLASDYDDAQPRKFAGNGDSGPHAPRAESLQVVRQRRVLLLGWNHVVPALLRELESYDDESFEVDIVSLVPEMERAAELGRQGVAPLRMKMRLLEGEYTSLADLRALEVASYDNVVVLSSDRLESEGERDARTILGSLVLREVLGNSPNKPHVLVEVLHEENVPLVADTGDETLLSPAVMSHILTQVALHRDLRVVYDELFGPKGTEIFFRPAAHYGICGRPVKFTEVQSAAAANSEVALGFRTAQNGARRGSVVLNPDRDQMWSLDVDDDVVVLASAR